MKKKAFKQDFLTYAIVIAFYAVCQILIMTGNMSSLMKGLMVPICYYVILAVSLNLVVGISGELSLGHAGFMCLGAFSGAFFNVLMKNTLSPLVSLIIALFLGAAVAAVFGFLIGIPVLRLRGDYLAIVTLAFGEIIKNVINVLYIGIDQNGVHFSMKDAVALGMDPEGTVLIKGAQGISGISRASTFTIGIILVLLTLVIVLNLTHSRAGRAIMAIRDNRIAAESIGLSIPKYKMLAFTLSAALAGMAGVLYAYNLSAIQATPKNFGYNMSIMILVFVVLGGIGNIRGSIIAAVILTILPEKLRFLSDYRMLIYAIVLIVMMIFNSAPACIQFRKTIAAKLAAKNGKGVK